MFPDGLQPLAESMFGASLLIIEAGDADSTSATAAASWRPCSHQGAQGSSPVHVHVCFERNDDESLHLISFRQGEVIGLFHARLLYAGSGGPCMRDSTTFVDRVRTSESASLGFRHSPSRTCICHFAHVGSPSPGYQLPARLRGRLCFWAATGTRA